MSKFVLIVLIYCALQSVNVSRKISINCSDHKNDTTEVLKIAFDSAFYRFRLPDLDGLTKHDYPFNDTIMFRSDKNSEAVKLFDCQSTNLNFKFLTRKEICDLATRNEDSSRRFPLFLELEHFKKEGSLFTVSLATNSIFPLYNEDGSKKYKKNMYMKNNNFNCYIFGNGHFYIEIQKTKTGFYVKYFGSSSN